MSHFAKVNTGVVENVIVAEQDFIDTYVDNKPGHWVQCSYNTIGGIHYVRNEDGTLGDPSEDQSKALRYNWPSVGWKYDKNADAFYPPQPYSSWTLDTDTYLWVAPVAYPDDGEKYHWNEDDQTWDAVE